MNCPCGARASDRCHHCRRHLCHWHVAAQPSPTKRGETVAVCHPDCRADWWRTVRKAKGAA